MNTPNNRKIVSNSFNNGIDLDSNPMVISNDSLTNCLNGTLITHNGNEFILQNDMGNGRVESAGLPAGYVPLGMKEFGGIVYVASKNVITGDCLIGSFPSPERNISANEIPDFQVPSIPTIENFCLDGEVVNTVMTTKIYPEMLKPGDKFKVNILNLECNKLLFDYNLGIKIVSGVEKRNWNIYYTDLANLLDFQNDELYPVLFYEENSKGELYLITEIKTPLEIDMAITEITEGSDNATVYYEIYGSPNLTLHVKINDKNFISKTLPNDGILKESIVIDKSNGIFSLTASPIVTHVVDSNNHIDYRIKSMTKTLTINIKDELSGILTLNQWRYSYNEDTGALDLTYGFSGALNTSYVEFNFYEYYDISKTFGFFKNVEADARRSYSGQFTDVIDVLNIYNLYLCEIICKQSKNSEHIQNTFYRLVWTNNILNPYNTSLENFDNSYIDLQSFIEGNTDVTETLLYADSNQFDFNSLGTTDEEGNYPNYVPNVVGPVGTKEFKFSYDFIKDVNFNPKYGLNISNIHKLPFDYTNLVVKQDELHNSDRLTVEYSVDNVDTKILNFGDLVENKNIEVNPSTNGNVRNRSLKVTYFYKALGKDTESESATAVSQIVKYLDTDKNVPEGHLTDMQKIFGHNNGMELGIGISTGCVQNSKTDDLISRYGLLKLDQEVSSKSDFESYGDNLARTENAANRDYSNVDRHWSNVMSGRLYSKIQDYYGYVPPICCIGSFRKRGITYGGEWRDGKANRDAGLIGYDYSDYTLITNYKDFDYNLVDFGKGSRNYIMPVWLDNSDLFRILINNVIKLEPEEKVNMETSTVVRPDYGNVLITSLKNIFSQLYVVDPERLQTVSNKYAKSDIDHYSYTKEVTGEVTFTEIIAFQKDLRNNLDTNDLYNESSETYVYSPNQSIKKAILTFESVKNVQILDLINPTLIQFNFPDIIENQYTITVPPASILNGVLAFLTAGSIPPAVGAVLIENLTTGAFKSKDGDGNEFDSRAIYYKSGNEYYSLSNDKHPEHCLEYAYKPNDEENTWAIRVSDLRGNLTIKEISYKGIRYSTIVYGSGSDAVGMTEDNFSQSNNPKEKDHSKLPYIGLVYKDSRSGNKNYKDRTETYPFSFVRGIYNKNYDSENAKFCVPLCLFPDNYRYKTSTYRNNNIKPT